MSLLSYVFLHGSPPSGADAQNESGDASNTGEEIFSSPFAGFVLDVTVAGQLAGEVEASLDVQIVLAC